MKRLLCPLLLLILAVPSFPPAQAEEEGDAGAEAPAVVVDADLAYVPGDAVDDRHKLDLYRPRGEGPWPTLVWIHGGAWAVGHRRDEAALARRFAREGIAVAAIDHRMSKALWIDPKLDEGVEHPAHVEDCAAAFAWVRAHAGAYGLDPDRMFVGGFSSGAHLAALLATDPRYLAQHGLEASAIRGALPVGGGYDIPAYYAAHREANGETMAEQHVLDVFGHAEGALEAASPVTHMAKTDVPMLVLSERNTWDYTRVFEEAVRSAGITRISFLHLPGRTHASIGRRMAAEGPDLARDALIAFMREQGATAPSAETR